MRLSIEVESDTVWSQIWKDSDCVVGKTPRRSQNVLHFHVHDLYNPLPFSVGRTVDITGSYSKDFITLNDKSEVILRCNYSLISWF